MKFVIIVDMSDFNDTIQAIVNEDGDLAQFSTFSDADEFMDTHPLNKFPYHVVTIGYGIPTNNRLNR